MTKFSVALAGVLVLAAASASTNVAFAAIGSTRTALAQGQAIDECRAQMDPQFDDHHARLAIEACVQRLMHASQRTDY